MLTNDQEKPANQEAGSDPVKDLARLFALSGKMHDFWSDEDFEEYKAIGRKWGLV